MKLTLAIAALALAGCARAHLPPVPGCHWGRSSIGAELYNDKDGVRVGSVVIGSSGYHAQGCFYLPDHSDCQQFETNEEAIEYIRRNVTGEGASQ